MKACLPDKVKALVDAPTFWYLATVNPHILLSSMTMGRVKPRNLACRPAPVPLTGERRVSHVER